MAFDQVILAASTLIGRDEPGRRFQPFRLGMAKRWWAFTVQHQLRLRHATIDTGTLYSAGKALADLIMGRRGAEASATRRWCGAAAGACAGFGGIPAERRKGGILASRGARKDVRPSISTGRFSAGARVDDPSTELKHGTDGGSGRSSLRHHAREVGTPMPPKSHKRIAKCAGRRVSQRARVRQRSAREAKFLRSRTRRGRAPEFHAGHHGKAEAVFRRPWGLGQNSR